MMPSGRCLIRMKTKYDIFKTENQKWIDFTKKYPNCKVTNKGITYKNGKIL